MINNSIIFFLGYYTYFDALLSLTPPKLQKTKIISKAKYGDIIPNQILKRGFNKNLDDFLNIIQKLSNKKRQLINISKRKLSMSKQKPKTIIISSLDNLGKENLTILVFTLILNTNVVDIAIIDTNIYYLVYKLKRAQVFAVLIKNLKFQVAKEVKPETDPKSIVLKKYHNLLDMFSKKT